MSNILSTKMLSYQETLPEKFSGYNKILAEIDISFTKSRSENKLLYVFVCTAESAVIPLIFVLYTLFVYTHFEFIAYFHMNLFLIDRILFSVEITF